MQPLCGQDGIGIKEYGRLAWVLVCGAGKPESPQARNPQANPKHLSGIGSSKPWKTVGLPVFKFKEI